ncbi:hypothetical protein [Clostridioides sp. ZZV14-6044]|uniref:hypothetical protein n=1 Tax=unclassified Clostridioides TaxID=2635829 RepID=UPI001D0C3009|nr:hypothetical protein [Clostridioides sp. ES-S-0001-03]MCC0660375.1 hypothetical protein [Clostridioides sp. ZZV14-6154]MCC0697466.1 hypothetical protein [Clostridioides sp. ES-S-0048-02]MCC0720823.1 hypothetical protein [Clostridioides sp. ZZV14-6104]MCC0725259.1 hypothetical protein [Clostridioides sp. ZZV14-6045]MCC0741368.1 hypothetical protein [Clostridioides sp. ZZV14-6044]MCC0749549.1 hypothetical protein [Clostridioides sp. ZZV13-5731]MDB0438089.1 hypothetical protein [Clostridioid
MKNKKTPKVVPKELSNLTVMIVPKNEDSLSIKINKIKSLVDELNKEISTIPSEFKSYLKL